MPNRTVFFVEPSGRSSCGVLSIEGAARDTVAQRKKNLSQFHEMLKTQYAGRTVVDIYTKAERRNEPSLCFAEAKKYTSTLNKSASPMALYYGSIVFENGGPYTDLYGVNGFKAGKDARLENSGNPTGFCFENEDYPLEPTGAFFDWLFCSALYENPTVSSKLSKYNAFLGVDSYEAHGECCPVRAAALYAALQKYGLTGQIACFSEFLLLRSIVFSDEIYSANRIVHVAENGELYDILIPGDTIIDRYGNHSLIIAVNDKYRITKANHTRRLLHISYYPISVENIKIDRNMPNVYLSIENPDVSFTNAQSCFPCDELWSNREKYKLLYPKAMISSREMQALMHISTIIDINKSIRGFCEIYVALAGTGMSKELVNITVRMLEKYGLSRDELVSLYEANHKYFAISPLTVIATQKCLEKYGFSQEQIMAILPIAVLLGKTEGISRISTVFASLNPGERNKSEALKEYIVNEAKNGFLFYGKHTNPTQAIKKLSRRFGKRKAFIILKEHPEVLYLWKTDDQRFTDRFIHHTAELVEILDEYAAK